MEAEYTFGYKGRTKTISCRSTYNLQLDSLYLFAAEIGYGYDPLAEGDGGNFIDFTRHKSPMERVSFNTMVSWYNNCFQEGSYWNGLVENLPEMSERLGLSVLDMKRAIDSKSIKKVYLQSSRGWLSVQKHIVTFVEDF
jgi:hypothetical protein